MERQYFNQALSDFISDAAYGGAVRHLAALGHTVGQIVQELDFPISEDRAGAVVWRYYLEEGIILLDEPRQGHANPKVSYVREYGKNGIPHFRRVVEQASQPQGEYCPCDFGRERQQDQESFLRKLDCLQRSDRAYILGLPWPLQRVYHIKDERMGRIMEKLGGQQ